MSLPPHQPYDCAIDLPSGAPLPSSRLYNLSHPEREAMEEYINLSRASGLIRPSSSPLGAGFFFVGKKDGSLCPFIDYRGLNDITIKNRYPLPLIDPLFEPLCHASVFTKLDLRNAYHLVRIREGDEWKTAFNTLLGHFDYQVMPFGLLISDVALSDHYCVFFESDISVYTNVQTKVVSKRYITETLVAYSLRLSLPHHPSLDSPSMTSYIISITKLQMS